MRTIAKGRVPASLAAYRAQAGATYHGFPDKAGLRECLVTEQRGLCCYCLSRIRPVHGQMKIEHWHAQSWHSQHPGDHANEELDYSNLLASCRGNEGSARHLQHCDTFKGDAPLSRNPARPEHQVHEIIRYGSAGNVFSTDPLFDSELNKVLKLNLGFIQANRKATLDALTLSIAKRQPLNRPQLLRWLADWSGDSTVGDLDPYCQVVVYWINKKLARLP